MAATATDPAAARAAGVLPAATSALVIGAGALVLATQPARLHAAFLPQRLAT
jgi:hypothetical protein